MRAVPLLYVRLAFVLPVISGAIIKAVADPREEIVPVKCPECGEETRAGDSCPKCGKPLTPSAGVRVEYKDFKGSEMLDIQMTGRAPSGRFTERPESEEPETARPVKPMSLSRKAAQIPLFAAIAFAVILTALAGYYLLRVIGFF